MQERRYPVLGGQIQSLVGLAGCRTPRGLSNNPIDLDLCHAAACLAACPEGAIDLIIRLTPACEIAQACVQGVPGGRSAMICRGPKP